MDQRRNVEQLDTGRGRHELIQHEREGEHVETLPSTLEQLISDRLRELPRAEHDIVDWLAVAGGPLLESDLLGLTRLADDEAIIRLCARGLCDRRAGSLDFRHPLARDVAYLALDPPSRARMHRRLGEQLATTPLAQGLSAAIVARHLQRGLQADDAIKEYLVLARGIAPAEFESRAPLVDDKEVERDAHTAFARVEVFPAARATLVSARLHTGRYHQIRRHLKHLSCPLIGDVRYGKGEHNRLFRTQHDLHRLALHCTRLTVAHPDGSTLAVECALPSDLEHALASCRRAYP